MLRELGSHVPDHACGCGGDVNEPCKACREAAVRREKAATAALPREVGS